MTAAPLRIGIVCYPTYGGSGVVATELGKALADQGHEVHFITYTQPVRLGSFHPRVFYHEVEVSKYPLFDYPPYELVLTSKMVEVATACALDLLHVHYAIPHASAALNARRILAKQGHRLPVVTTLHGTDITLLGPGRVVQAVDLRRHRGKRRGDRGVTRPQAGVRGDVWRASD